MSEPGRTVPCPVCAADVPRPWSTRHRNRIVRCGACGTFYVSPVPATPAYERAVTESLVYTYDQLVKRAFFERRADELLRDVEARTGVGRLLDVGCGIGTELSVARRRGWTVTGIELSAPSLEVARREGLDVLDVPLGRAPLAAGAFDLVTFNHALEHFVDPHGALAETHRVLRPDGLLFVAVPNVDAWKRFVLRDRDTWIFNDDHFVHYGRRTLAQLLARTGFRVLATRTPRWVDWQRRPLAAYPAWFRWLDRLVERAGLGIELFVLARRTAGA